jgi:hypothetical protein
MANPKSLAESKGNILTGSKKNGSTIHPSSIQKGTGSGNLYKHVPANAVDKQNVKSHGKYGI